MKKFLILALAALAVLGCEDGTDGTLNGITEADATMGDNGLQAPDGADIEAPAEDLGAPDETGATDAPEDVAPDTAEDVAVADLTQEVAPDVGVDIAPDTKPDVTADAVPDSSVDPCTLKLKTFKDLQAKALQCTTPFDCFVPGPSSPSCPGCGAWHNGNKMDTQTLIDITDDFKKSGCGGTCTSACNDMARMVGVCAAGACQTKELTCKELDQAASLAIAQGSKCTTDDECTFKVSNTLGCGCPTYVSMTNMKPGSTLFQYMKVLVLAYKTKVCTPDVTCGCVDPTSAKCVAGVCIGQ